MQNHTWLLEVLADVEVYARGNDLPDLAKVLPAVKEIAHNEIAAIPFRRAAPFPTTGDNFVVFSDTGAAIDQYTGSVLAIED
jgi:hypothetical protein